MQVRIETKADLAILRPLNLFVRSLLQQIPALQNATQMVNHLELAFNEAFVNIYEHAYKGEAKGPVIITISIDNSSVEFRLEDFGEDFDPAMIPEPNLESPKEGGLGIWLMKYFMDKYLHSREADEKNVLILVKKLP
jgi:anti-sigma regulatory factor (Ser/Thr protein kinase)